MRLNQINYYLPNIYCHFCMNVQEPVAWPERRKGIKFIHILIFFFSSICVYCGFLIYKNEVNVQLNIPSVFQMNNSTNFYDHLNSDIVPVSYEGTVESERKFNLSTSELNIFGNKAMLFTGGFTFETTRAARVYPSSGDELWRVAGLPNATYLHQQVSDPSGNIAFVSGGRMYAEKGTLSSAYAWFSQNSTQWWRLPKLKHARANHGMQLWGNGLVSFGGSLRRSSLTKSVEFLPLRMSALPIARSVGDLIGTEDYRQFNWLELKDLPVVLAADRIVDQTARILFRNADEGNATLTAYKRFWGAGFKSHYGYLDSYEYSRTSGGFGNHLEFLEAIGAGSLATNLLHDMQKPITNLEEHEKDVLDDIKTRLGWGYFSSAVVGAFTNTANGEDRVRVGDRLVVIGGLIGSHASNARPSDSVAFLDSMHGVNWEFLPSIPVKGGLYKSCAVAVSDTEIIVIGGMTGAKVPSRRVLVLDVLKRKWRKVARLNVGRVNPSCSLVETSPGHKEIIIVGGKTFDTLRVDAEHLTWPKEGIEGEVITAGEEVPLLDADRGRIFDDDVDLHTEKDSTVDPEGGINESFHLLNADLSSSSSSEDDESDEIDLDEERKEARLNSDEDGIADERDMAAAQAFGLGASNSNVSGLSNELETANQAILKKMGKWVFIDIPENKRHPLIVEQLDVYHAKASIIRKPIGIAPLY